MNKFYGVIGYKGTYEDPNRPGIWLDEEIERPYYGDILKNTLKYGPDSKVNEDVSISNRISILCDPYAMNHVKNMKYITFMGSKWTITDVEVNYPRLILSLGGLYND